MRTICLTIICCLTVLAAEAKNAPATLLNVNGKELKIYVSAHHYDKIIYALDARSGQLQPLDGKQIVRVTYGKAQNGSLLRGMGYEKSGSFDQAVSFFLKAGKEAWYQWEQVDGFLRAAEVRLSRQKKPAEAVKVIDDLLKEFPTTARYADALTLKARAQIAAKQTDAALKTYKQLISTAAKMSPLLALEARARAAAGQAELHTNKGSPQDAIRALQAVSGELDPGQLPDQFAQVRIALGVAQAAAGDQEGALATLADIVYKPIDRGYQGRAHLERAKILQAQGKKIQAFDAAVFATLRGSNDVNVGGPARSLVKKLGTQLGKDESLSPEDQREYRTYGGKL